MFEFKEGTVSFDTWNEEIVPRVKDGTYKDASDLLKDSFLVIGQLMRCLILVEGNYYYCTAWSGTGVTIKLENSFKSKKKGKKNA